MTTLVQPGENLINRSYVDNKNNKVSIVVVSKPDGELECSFHNSSVCSCIDAAIHEGWDAEYITPQMEQVVIPFNTPTFQYFKLRVHLDTDPVAGGGRRASCHLRFNPTTLSPMEQPEYFEHSLGYLMPGEGRFALLQAFHVPCSDFVFRVQLREQAGHSPLALICRSKTHGYAFQNRLEGNFKAGATAVREAASLLLTQQCLSCNTITQTDFEADVPTP